MSKQQQTDEEFIESTAIKFIKHIRGNSKNELSTLVGVDENDITISLYWSGDEDGIAKAVIDNFGKLGTEKPFLDVVYESCEGMTREEQIEHQANIVRHLRRYADEIEKWEVTP